MASSNPAKSNNRRPEWFFTKEELAKAPSIKAGLPLNKELSYRQQSANFIQDMGQHLRVTQLCINTAIVYCQRFYMFHTYQQFHRNSIALSALFLAAKVEEQPRKLEHLIKMSHICLHGRDAPPLDIRSDLYQEKAQELVTNENILLQTLGFDVAIDHPHTHVVRCCQLVKASKELAQASYYLATNSLHLTTFCCRYSPTIVACFCIHLACKWSNYKIPLSAQNKEWYVYVDEKATHDLLEELTEEFLTIYKQCPSRLKNKIKASTQAAREEEEQRRANEDTEGQFPSAPVLTTEASGSSSATDRGFTYSPTSQSSRSEVVHSRQAHPHPQSSHRHQQERASTGVPMGGGHRPQHVSASQSHPSSKRPTEVTSSINLEEYRKLNRQPTSSSSSDLKPVHISGSVAIHQKHHHGQTGHKHHSSSGPHQHHRHHHSQPQKTEPRSHTSQSLARPIQIPAPIPAQIIQPSFAHPPPYYPIRTSTSTTPTKRSEGNILPIGIFSTTTSTPTCFGPTPPPPPPLPPPLPPTLPPPPPPPRSTIQSPLRVDQKKVAAFKDQDLEPGEIADSPTDSKSFGVDWPKKSDERSKSGHHRIKSDPHHSSSRGSTHAKSHSSHHRDPMKISAKPYSSSFVKQELHSKPEEHLTRVNAVTQIKSEVKGLPSVQVKIESGSKSFTSATANPSSHLKTEPSSTNFKIQPGLQIKPEPGGASKLTSHKSEPRDSGDSRKEHRVHSKTSREMQTIDVKPAFNNVQVKVESVKQDPVVKTVPSVHIKLESSSKATLGTSKPEVHTTKEKSQVKTDSHNSVPKFVKPESGENLTETKRERSPSVKIEKVEGFENNHDGRKSGALVVVESDKHRDRRHKEKKKKKDKKRDRDDVDHKNGESKRHKHKHKDRSRERDSSSTMPGIKLKIKTMPPLENRAAEPPLVPIKISLASSQAESRDKKRPRPHSGLSEVAGPASKMSRALGSLVERENQFYSMVATEAERKSEQKPSKKV